MRIKFKHKWFKILILISVFIGFFLFFFLRNHYYVPARLVISGEFTSDTETNLSWDSGRGFNKNEVMPVSFEKGSKEESIVDPKLGLKIKYTDETKSVSIDLPQLGIRSLMLGSENPNSIEIDSLKIESENGEQVLSWTSETGTLFKTNINTKQISKVNLILVTVQILLSLFLVWVIYELFNLKKRYFKSNLKTTLKYIFIEEKRWTFWLMGIIAVVVYSFWLLGQWPGAVSPDSLYQLFQTKSLELENSHPYLSTLYMLFLMQFYDSFGSIAIFQILATSFLGSFVFYFVYKNGLKWYLILPFYLGFIFSIPIGLFNVIIWKDVPFSILVVFWGFHLFYLGFQKSKRVTINFSLKKIIVLSFLFILMTLIRHNGQLYLIIIPLILFYGQLMPKKVLVKFLLCSVVFFLLFKYFLFYAFAVKSWSPKITTLTWKMHPIATILLSKNYISRDYAQDKQTIEKIITIEDMRKNYDPDYATDLGIGWDDYEKLKDEDIKAVNKMFYRLALENLPIFIGERTHLFIALLSPRAGTWSNDFYCNHYYYYKSYIYLWRSGTSLYMQYHPIQKLSDIQLKFFTTVTEKNKPIVFDLFYPTFVLLIILFCYKWIPLSARSSFFILSQLPFWFVFLISPSFRYLYFIFFYYFFIFPLLILEINLIRDQNPASKLHKKLTYNLVMVLLYLIFVLPYIIEGVLLYLFRSFFGGVLLNLFGSFL